MMSELLLSIDLGTTRLKVAAFSLDGTLQQLEVRRHEERRERSGGVERCWQSAERWWLDTVAATRALLAALPPARVLGIGLSGRGGAAVFVDDAGDVVADPWSDDRHQNVARELRAAAGDSLSSYGIAMAAKYLWLRAEQPEAARRVRHACYAKDWLVYRLTGRNRTDLSSGPDAPAWPPELAMLGIPEGVLPDPGLPWTLAGELTAPAAAALGLPAGTPVALGAHDGVAANIGAGAFSEREYVITLGTHAVVRTVAVAPPAGARRFYGFPPGSHVIGGNAWFAGRTADWLLELLGLAGSDDRTRAYRELERLAGTVPAGARGVRFLPYLEGQRAPEYHPGARGAFAGLALAHGQAELGRAVLEGAACAVRAVFEEVAGWCGPPRRLRVTGGGAENRLWLEILVNLLGEPIEWTGPAAEARGAAICLAVALGIHEDPAQAAAAMVAVDRRIEPEPALAAAYEEIYRDWDRLGGLSRVLI